MTLGCKTDTKLTYETLQFQNDECTNCPEVQINIPKFVDESRVATAINSALTEELIYSLKWEDDDDESTLKGAVQSFTNSYQKLQKKFEDEVIPWEAEVNAEVVYETESIIGIRLNSYTFTGGAHGYSATILLNFDKFKATEIDNHELFDDLAGFIALAEKRFRKEHKIPAKATINETGFMFNGDSFHLSENMGLTDKGLQLIYNQYEIASYADGPIKMIIPFRIINPFLKEVYRVKQD